jgi:FkbM family methyltransferase
LAGRTGSPYSGSTRDMHAHFFAIHGYYDWRLLATASFFLRPGDRAIEVGANVGTETIGLADLVGPTGQVYAFEPFPANADLLRRAMTAAGLGQVEVFQAAVSEQAGTIRFAPAADERETGSGRIATGTEGGTNELTVECLTLDSFLAQRGPIRLMVVDVEGAEMHVLRGGREVLRRDRPVIILEAQEEAQRQFGFGLTDLHAELQAHEYQVYELVRIGLGKLDLENKSRNRNWVALPPALHAESGRLHRHLIRCGLMPCLFGLNPLTRRYR